MTDAKPEMGSSSFKCFILKKSKINLIKKTCFQSTI